MHLQLISADRLRITLTSADLTAYALPSHPDPADTGTRRALWALFDDVKKRSGFDAAAGRLFLQMTPSSAGGGELVVTRVREPHADAALTVQPAVRAFRFPTAEALCDACARLRAAGYARESRAYLLCGGEALLTLAAPVPDGIDCRAETDAALLACLTEHGTLLCENAVSLLSPIGE